MEEIKNNPPKEDKSICPTCKGWGQLKFDKQFVNCTKCNGKGKLNENSSNKRSPR